MRSAVSEHQRTLVMVAGLTKHVWSLRELHALSRRFRSRQRGMTILLEDVTRLSPIGHEHVNVYGKYSFTLAEPIQQGAFRPLRELDETEPQTEFVDARFGA